MVRTVGSGSHPFRAILAVFQLFVSFYVSLADHYNCQPERCLYVLEVAFSYWTFEGFYCCYSLHYYTLLIMTLGISLLRREMTHIRANVKACRSYIQVLLLLVSLLTLLLSLSTLLLPLSLLFTLLPSLLQLLFAITALHKNAKQKKKQIYSNYLQLKGTFSPIGRKTHKHTLSERNTATLGHDLFPLLRLTM